MRLLLRHHLDFVQQTIELFRLQRALPHLRNSSRLLGSTQPSLQLFYELYTSTVSTQDMAISLELSEFLLFLCETLRPNYILDLGSGFSSFVFRLYAKHRDPKPVIWSVDDSREWLEKTTEFLASYELDCNSLDTWDSFVRLDQRESFDLILHDLGDMETRKRTFEDVLSFAKPYSVIVLDDFHKQNYKSYVEQVLSQHVLRYYSLKSLTMDKFGRFASLVITMDG